MTGTVVAGATKNECLCPDVPQEPVKNTGKFDNFSFWRVLMTCFECEMWDVNDSQFC